MTVATPNGEYSLVVDHTRESGDHVSWYFMGLDGDENLVRQVPLLGPNPANCRALQEFHVTNVTEHDASILVEKRQVLSRKKSRQKHALFLCEERQVPGRRLPPKVTNDDVVRRREIPELG